MTTSLKTAAAVILATGILTAGCGGGSTSTVTVTNASTPPTTTSAPASTAATGEAEFAAYLAALKTLRSEANTKLDHAKKTLNPVSNDPTTADEAASAKALHNAAVFISNIAAMAAAVPAPKGLEGASAVYAQAFQDFSNGTADLSSDVKDYDLEGIQQDINQLEAVEAKIAKWKIAVIQYATAHGYPIPAWVRHSGEANK